MTKAKGQEAGQQHGGWVRIAAGLCIAGLSMSAAQGAAVTASFTATQDTYIHSSLAGPFGSATTMEIKNVADGDNFNRKAYLEFDTSSRSGRQFVSATLALPFVAAGGTEDTNSTWNFGVYGLTDNGLDNWSEATATWSSSPGPIAPANIASGAGSAAGFDPAKSTSLGNFNVTGRGTTTQTFSSAGLLDFVVNDANHLNTIMIGRNTAQFGTQTVVHAIRTNNSPSTPHVALQIVENNLLANGDLELGSGTSFTSWTNNSTVASTHAALTGGSARAAFLDTSKTGEADLRQTVHAAGSSFMFETYFATENGGGGANDRGFNLIMTALNGSGQINMRVNGQGAVQVFNNSTWVTILAAGSVAFSNDANNNLDFTDDVINSYRLRIIGKGWGTATPTYDVLLSGANGTTFLLSAMGVNAFQGGAPTSAAQAGINEVIFETEFGNGDFAVDAAYLQMIPEPSSLALMALGMITLARRRR